MRAHVSLLKIKVKPPKVLLHTGQVFGLTVSKYEHATLLNIILTLDITVKSGSRARVVIQVYV